MGLCKSSSTATATDHGTTTAATTDNGSFVLSDSGGKGVAASSCQVAALESHITLLGMRGTSVDKEGVVEVSFGISTGNCGVENQVVVVASSISNNPIFKLIEVVVRF